MSSEIVSTKSTNFKVIGVININTVIYNFIPKNSAREVWIQLSIPCKNTHPFPMQFLLETFGAKKHVFSE